MSRRLSSYNSRPNAIRLNTLINEVNICCNEVALVLGRIVDVIIVQECCVCDMKVSPNHLKCIMSI